jgi:hypothetical protein
MTRERANHLWGAYWKGVELVLDEFTEEDIADVEDKFDIIGDIIYREWGHLLGDNE